MRPVSRRYPRQGWIGASSFVVVEPSTLTATWALQAPSILAAVLVTPQLLETNWTAHTAAATIAVTIAPSALATTWALQAPSILTEATISPSVLALTWTAQAATASGAGSVDATTLALTWALNQPSVQGAARALPSAASLTWALVAPNVGPALMVAQKTIGGEPVISLTIGAHDLSDYVVGYKYEEFAQESGGLGIWLDNRDGNFDDLATDWPDLVRGEAVNLARGLLVDGNELTRELPRTWVESIQYAYDDGAALLLVDCIDWWGRLENFRFSSLQTYTSQTVQAIIETILETNLGFTLMAGSLTSLTINHEVDFTDDGDDAVRDLMDKIPEFLYAGLDGEIKFKELDPDETATYAYGWNDGGEADHPCLDGTEIAESSPEYNRITVLGGSSDQFSGTASDAGEIALVGTRQLTIRDESLSSNAQCSTRASGELTFWQSRATAGQVVARPNFYLRMYDVISVDAPPWGGTAVSTGRVTGIVEEYGFDEWEQEIQIGDLPEQSLYHYEDRPGRGKRGRGNRKSHHRKSRKRKSRSTRRSSTRKRYRRYAYWPHYHSSSTIVDGSITEDQLADGVFVPIGGVIFWPSSAGAIPSGWVEYTPLQQRFPIGAGGAFTNGSTGGATTHSHGPGTLSTDSDSHTHTGASLALSTDTHSHTAGTLATANDTHSHAAGTLDWSASHSHGLTGVVTGAPSATVNVPGGITATTAASGAHTHTIGSGENTQLTSQNIDVDNSTATDTHNHDVTGATVTDGHDHDVSGSTGSDAHNHDVTSGVTDASVDLPVPWLAGMWIQRIS